LDDAVAEAEQHFNAVERLVHHAYNIDHEAPLHIADKMPPLPWPRKGSMEFSGVHLRYRPGLPYVLQDLSFSVQGGERIGIVGRTGAGKSSMAVALLRLTEVDKGAITIDGVDLDQLGLHDVRRRIAIIPQGIPPSLPLPSRSR
jgi:ABC-type multidrug transport system fused ATPase/permease subunit